MTGFRDMKKTQKILIGVMSALMALVTLDFLFPPPLKNGALYSPLVLDRNGHWVHAFTNDQGRWQFHADIDQIDQTFIKNLVLIEDKRFFRHWGVDFIAIMRASKTSLGAGHIVSGASTITMQTARLLEPRKRNVGSKLIEMVRAVQIERRLTKNEILSLYLTLAPYGGNIQGVRAASLSWFGKEPRYLTHAEQALLIALPQAPEARRPDRRIKTAYQARLKILQKLESLNALTKSMLAESHGEEISKTKKGFPKAAWHLAYELSHFGNRNSSHRTIQNGIYHSALDLRMQLRAETMVKNHLQGEEDDATGAIIIVDNNTRQVRALVGSSGLETKGGWNDMSNILRSPGSAMKPFIYAMAFEDGSLSANTMIEDLPQSFGGYNPENFDRKFRGTVRIREALQHSLNVPAVGALEQVGPTRFSSFLKMAGVNLITPKKQTQEAGLALALGGAGIKMRDLATLYAGLGNGGRVAPLRFKAKIEYKDEGEAFQFVSKRTADEISKILASAPSLKGRVPAALTRKAPHISFKTGTSYGFRDAWSAGYNKDYTVIVWIGRADGAPRPGKTGRTAAAPLLFSIFDMLAQSDRDHFDKESETDKRKFRKYENNKHDLLAFNEQENFSFLEHITAPTITNANLHQSENTPEIIFPQEGIELFIKRQDKDVKQRRGHSLQARGGQGGKQWYVNGQKINPDPIGGQFIWYPAKSGFYTVRVIDDAGAEQKVRVRVSETI